MKIYTIIGGVNGAGKSSLTGALKAERTDLGHIIDVDLLNAACGSAIEGGKRAIRKLDDCLEKGLNFTQETTLSGVRTERTARRAKEAHYYIRLYYVGLDTVQDSLDRIKNRVTKGGHAIAESDVQRRFKTRFRDVLRVLPYCDEAVFFDNDNGFLQVAEYRNGELLPLGQARPAWLTELEKELREGAESHDRL